MLLKICLIFFKKERKSEITLSYHEKSSFRNNIFINFTQFFNTMYDKHTHKKKNTYV